MHLASSKERSRILFVYAFLLWTFGGTPQSVCDNFHEHLTSAPSPDDFVQAIDEIRRIPLLNVIYQEEASSVRDGLVSGPYTAERRLALERKISRYLYAAIEPHFAGQPDATMVIDYKVNEALQRILSKSSMTFGEFLSLLPPATPEVHLRHLLSIDPADGGSRLSYGRSVRSQNRHKYIGAEVLRNGILGQLSPQGFYKVFDHYFKNLSPEQKNHFHVTVPSGLVTPLVDKENPNHDIALQRLVALRNAAKDHGVSLKIFAGIPRESIVTSSDNAFRRRMESVGRLLSSSFIHGVDISGSMLENSTKADFDLPPGMDSQKLASRISQVFDVVQSRNGTVRVHAFEAGPEGGGNAQGIFYDALWKALDEYQKSLNLRIGHINGLTPEWIEHLRKFQDRRRGRSNQNSVTFDANIYSNQLLQSATLANLIKQIRLLQANGFKVYSGSDGHGILGELSEAFWQQFALEMHLIQNNEVPNVRLDTECAAGFDSMVSGARVAN